MTTSSSADSSYRIRKSRSLSWLTFMALKTCSFFIHAPFYFKNIAIAKITTHRIKHIPTMKALSSLSGWTRGTSQSQRSSLFPSFNILLRSSRTFITRSFYFSTGFFKYSSIHLTTISEAGLFSGVSPFLMLIKKLSAGLFPDGSMPSRLW